MRKKTRCAVDNFNRLILRVPGGQMPVNGIFSLDESNNLIYNITESKEFINKHGLSKKTTFKGRWSLNKDYDLELCISEKTAIFLPEVMVLKGKVLSAEENALLFEVNSVDKSGNDHIRVLRLTGQWQADERNRIIFSVKKEKDSDLLIFGADWQLDKNQHISYSYQKKDLKKKQKELHTFSLKGFWQINATNKITYLVSYGSNSILEFYVNIESPNIYPQEGVLKYRLGTGFRSTRRAKIICFYGQWKFSRRAALLFEMQYEKGKFRSMEFGIDLIIDKKDKVIFCLKDSEGLPLGISVIFSRKMLAANAEMFVKFQYLEGKPAAFGGVKIPF